VPRDKNGRFVPKSAAEPAASPPAAGAANSVNEAGENPAAQAEIPPQATRPAATPPQQDATPPRPPAESPPVPEGYRRDAQGRLVPLAMVKREHLLEDELVRDLHSHAVAISELLRKFRTDALFQIDALQDLLAEKYNAQRGGQRGNLTLSTYDGMLRVQLAIADQVELGPELQVAKSLVDECIRGWSKGASVELQAIVMDAFDVDKKGRLNTDRILGLRRLAIEDPNWLKAMEAIGDAVRVVSSKRYLRFYSRAAQGDKLNQVPLDMTSV
jgi:hypothetical protein